VHFFVVFFGKKAKDKNRQEKKKVIANQRQE